MLALDDRAFQLAVQTGTLQLLETRFQGAPPAGQTYGSLWNSILNSPSFAAGLPKPVSGGVRVFERHYSLHTP